MIFNVFRIEKKVTFVFIVYTNSPTFMFWILVYRLYKSILMTSLKISIFNLPQRNCFYTLSCHFHERKMHIRIFDSMIWNFGPYFLKFWTLKEKYCTIYVEVLLTSEFHYIWDNWIRMIETRIQNVRSNKYTILIHLISFSNVLLTRAGSPVDPPLGISIILSFKRLSQVRISIIPPPHERTD
jgi:hypothetical protein